MKQFIILCDLKQLFDKKHEHNVYRSCFNTNKCFKKKIFLMWFLKKLQCPMNLTDLAQICRRQHVAEQLEFLVAWPDAFRCQDKSQVGLFGVAEGSVGQVDFELVLMELSKDLVKNL